MRIDRGFLGKACLVAALLQAPMATAQTISAYAGLGTAGYNGDGSPATAYQMNQPGPIAVDLAGNLFIADTLGHRLRKVTLGGTISTVVGTGAAGPALNQLNTPTAVAVHAATGDVYVADTSNHRILRLPAGAGPAVLFAGTGTAGNGGVGIPATTSALNSPSGVAVDAAGDVYISDSLNYRIRKVSAGIVSIVVGTGAPGCSATQMNFARGLAFGNSGELYIADTGNHRVMTYPGTGPSMSIFAGQPSAITCTTGAGVSQLNSPVSVAVTQLGDVLITDTFNHVLKRVRSGVMSVVVGSTGSSGTTGDNGPATSALLGAPRGVAVGQQHGHLYYVADTLNHRVRKVVPQVAAAPTINSITPSATSLSIAFTPNSTLDAPATSFTATCDPGAFATGGTSSPLVVSGLASGTQYGCTVYSVNAAGASPLSNIVLATPGTAPAITSAAPAGGMYGVIYGHTYSASGTPASTYSVTSGALPAGLSLASGGALTGTPTAVGNFTGVVTAANGIAPNATQAFSITIAKAAQAINFAALPDRTIGSGPFTLNATGGGSGNAIVFTSQTTGTCTATGTNGTTLTLIATGNCTIAANQAGGVNHDAAPQVTQAFTIQAKVAQAITFGALADVLQNAGPVTLSATGGGSGNPITFSSLTTSTCTTGGTNGATLTLVVPGTCTVAANQAGNSAYDPAPQVSRSFTVLHPGRLVNISTRMQVLTGDDVMIGGFIIGGTTPKTVVVRARGPSLALFGVQGVLANPLLQIFSGPTQLAVNDNWGDAANAAAISASGFAPSDAVESAVMTTLAPGGYTAIVSGVGGTTGVGIIEVFEVDELNTPLLNIATRGRVQTADNVMIAGFVMQGDGPRTVVVRARGPSLAQSGVPGVLMNPTLQLFSGTTQIGANDNWGDAANAAAIQASGFAPLDANESALLVTLTPGAYSVVVSGVGGTTGVAIVEVFRN